MKVLITGCSKETDWYEDMIGENYEVASEYNLGFSVLLSEDSGVGFIKREDCHVIQSIGTVLMEWEKNGGELGFWGQSSKAWIKVDDRDEFRLNSILRIKPVEQPQYRPYTFEEAKEVFTKDGFGVWVKSADTGAVGLVCYVSDTGVSIPGIGGFLFESLLQYCTHLDGTPCGVKIN